MLPVAFAAWAAVACAAPKTVPKRPADAKAPAGLRPAAADDLYEGPAVSKSPKPEGAIVAGENKLEAPLSPGPKYADAWPSEKRKAERDLGLTRDAENRALAVAAFAEGQMADDKGDPDKALEAWKRATTLDPANSDLAVKVAFQLA